MTSWHRTASELWQRGLSTGKVLDGLAEKGFVVAEADFSRHRKRFPDDFPSRSNDQRKRNIGAANTGKRRS